MFLRLAGLLNENVPIRWFRHPSYAGFFYWALGTQLVLQNPISFTIYSILLRRFFFYRIRCKCPLIRLTYVAC